MHRPSPNIYRLRQNRPFNHIPHNAPTYFEIQKNNQPRKKPLPEKDISPQEKTPHDSIDFATASRAAMFIIFLMAANCSSAQQPERETIQHILKHSNPDNPQGVPLEIQDEGILEIIKKGDTSILKNKPDLCDDEDWMLKAIVLNPEAKKYISSRLLTNYPFVSKAIKAMSAHPDGADHINDFIGMVSGFMKGEDGTLGVTMFKYQGMDNVSVEDFAIEATLASSQSIRHFAKIKNNKNSIKRMIEAGVDPEILLYSELNGDSDFILELVAINVAVLDYTNTTLINDKDFITRATEINEKAILYAGELLQNDMEFMQQFPKIWNQENILSAITDGKPNAASYLPDSSKKDLKFMLNLVHKTPSLYRFADPSIKLNTKLLYPELKRMGFTEKELESIASDLETLNIRFPERFSKEHLLEVIKNRKAFEGGHIDAKKIAVFLYNQYDWNSSYQTNDISDFIDHGYYVLYFESSDLDQALGYMDQYLGLYDSDMIPGIDIQENGGHGCDGGKCIRMGQGKNGTIHSKLGDIWRKYREIYNPNGIFISRGCSTGKGKKGADNLANMYGEAIPQVSIFSPAKGSYGTRISFNRLDNVETVDFRIGNGGVYRIDPDMERWEAEKDGNHDPKTLEEAEQLGILHAKRFSPKELEVLIENRETKELPDKPIATLFYTSNDESEDFIGLRNKIHELNEQGFHILYYEVGGQDDIKKVVRKIRKKNKRRVDYVGIGGEKTKNGIRLGYKKRGEINTKNAGSFFGRISASLSKKASVEIDTPKEEGDAMTTDFQEIIQTNNIGVMGTSNSIN